MSLNFHPLFASALGRSVARRRRNARFDIALGFFNRLYDSLVTGFDLESSFGSAQFYMQNLSEGGDDR